MKKTINFKKLYSIPFGVSGKGADADFQVCKVRLKYNDMPTYKVIAYIAEKVEANDGVVPRREFYVNDFISLIEQGRIKVYEKTFSLSR